MNRSFFINKLLLLISVVLISSCSEPEDTYEILFSGGYYGGGVNPSISETIIHKSGKIVITTDYLFTDSRVTEKQAEKSEVESLYHFMIENRFTDLNDIYDCAPNDSICEDIRDHYPPPNPLTIKLTDNSMSHSVNVSVFQCSVIPIIEYPDILDSISFKIWEIVHESN